MAILRSFRGYRPRKELAGRIASLPYDVLSSEEAREVARNNPDSFIRVVKPEVDFPSGKDPYAEEVYQKGKTNLEKMISEGILFQDPEPCLYIYAQTMNGKTQYGIVGCANVLDYLNNAIRRHELTRHDKQEDRRKHILVSGFHAEPVFFAHPPHTGLDMIVAGIAAAEPEYDFEADDGIRHRFWVIRNNSTIAELERIFATDIPFTYVADGHHRTAAAAGVADDMRHSDPDHNGREEYNYFLAALFPADQLTIIDYNRLVKDLNGMKDEEFLRKLETSFTIEGMGKNPFRPRKLHQFGLYIGGKWYALTLRANTDRNHTPISKLDVTILSEKVLSPLLGITDLRKSKKIDFVGGIRGLSELEKRVDSGEMKAAFSLFPVSMEQLMDIADSDSIMPPKTTWFEPKLRSGLILHKLNQ